MERIHVAVRARPLTAEDAGSSPWRVSGNAIALSTQPSIRFEFDRIFGEECRTADVYGARTKHIVDSAVRGFNGTVFAYGQTNSGKTYTMRGSGNEPGIIPLAVHDLFRTIEEHLDREFLLRMSYMEIYNEEINDLLVPEHRKLQIHESIERGIYVAGLREEIVTCPEQVLEFMSFGESHRHIGETNMNVYSSRSHTIFRMVIESREKVDESEAGELCDAVRISVLNLVDLAGSERAAKTGAEGVRLKEGSHINKSLMTLGTVIKKLSEGIEGQGGHVPYRDSKLTRILQPALGGNANTAIICNITLAQVHADETKSSLQFASRALRVTNCACVNEILTDAALLKRQRKEIEELRAKLRSELEKERISLELEEEKKAKEQRDKRLIEQAKKIENLSSLVLNSERDDRTTVSSKNKRRLTWCPGLLSRQFDGQVLESVQEDPPSSTVRHGRNMEMPLHFEELMQESCESSIKHCTDAYSSGSLSCEDDSLPDSHALLHVTSRRKPNTMKKSDQEQLMGLVSERIIPQELNDWKYTTQSQENIKACVNGLSARESEAILVIKQLEDQIKLLELEKSSFQSNLDDVLELATQQKASFHEKYEELQQNALVAQEQAKIANEKLSKQEAAYEFLTGIFVETESIAVQMDQSTRSVDNALSFIEELFQNLFMMAKNFNEVKQFVCGDITQFSSVIRDYENISNCLREKLSKLEMEKDCNIQNELEKDSILSELLTLQKEVVYLSSSSLMKEKESIRKELDRTKTKLKETENKLKNSIQEKIKLESEKAEAQREIKKLQSQRTLLERDLRKRDSFTVDKRHEQNVKSKELAGIYDQAVQIQEDYGKLEMHAFDMEAEIASLQEALVTTIAEKEEALSRVELLTSAVEDLESRLNSAESETSSLLEETAVLTRKLDASESISKKLEASISSLSREKEDMGIELTDVLLEMESERSTWTAKEKACLEAKQKLNICNENNCKLSEDLIKEVKQFVCGDITQFSSVIRDYENISNCLREKLSKLEMEKDCNIQNELEKDSILSELLTLQKEVVYLSSSSLMKEKESIRKELDRTKTKLKETENKLKNSIQEKIKLESEKAEAQREIKKLQSQRTLLERDLRKRDSFTVDKRHEQNVKSKELAGIYDQAVQIQEDYGKLEMHAFDMEAEIASLQEALVTTIAEKEEALSRVELLTSAVEDLESRLNSAESETSSLLEETAVLTRKLDASESISKKLEASISSLSREKEDMGIELTDVLLEMESERSTWTAKEKACLEAKQKLNICNENNCKLSEDLIKVRQELACCREQYSILEAKMIFSKNDTNEEKYCRETCEESERLLKKEINIDTGVNENLIQAKATIDELSSRISIVEAKMKNDASAYNKENTKLRMQIRWMQPELDAHRGRLKEAINEMKLMDTKYQEASTKLKKDLSFYCREVLRLKEQLKESQRPGVTQFDCIILM
uniref:Kinesin motor domain-containing protein n=1 Tax=Oryza meridionalis TaxID=40149 RepID=A0A0E0ESB6_9ORYZ